MNQQNGKDITESFGFLVVDKPGGMTSHDVVAKVRRGTRIKRIGHAGTLDPMATGVLVLCLGAATRLSEYVMASSKRYTATIRLGIETDTYDADGQVIQTADLSLVTREVIEGALTHFQGQVEQIPPMYSALKQDGKRLYDLARAGQEVERKPRTVELQTAYVAYTPPDLKIDVICSAGTYIRSIAHDLGAYLGVGGHLTRLRRESSGSLDHPVAWDTLSTAMLDGSWQRYLIDERVALAALPEVTLSQEAAQAVFNGRTIERGDRVKGVNTPILAAGSGKDGETGNPIHYRAYSPGNRFIAILTLAGENGEYWQPEKVFHPT